MTDKIFKHLVSLYKQMDNTWETIAADYHFKCNGCKDNCCKSLFFHHTHIERAYFLFGFNLLDEDQKATVMDRAEHYCKKTFSNKVGIKSLKIMCPANENGLCLLYAYRPMICRLHGLPHELNRPGFDPVKSAGCATGLFDKKTYIKFDRTPFYQQMVRIEMAFQQDFNKTGKIRKTIAQILVSQ